MLLTAVSHCLLNTKISSSAAAVWPAIHTVCSGIKLLRYSAVVVALVFRHWLFSGCVMMLLIYVGVLYK